MVTKNVKKAGSLGLKGTLSVLSMSAAMALFSAMEEALAPRDVEGYRLIQAERKAYLAMAKGDSGWSSPWTYSGALVCFFVIFGGSLSWCRFKKSKDRQETQPPMIVLGAPRKEEEHDEMPAGPGDGGIKFGDVNPSMMC